MQPCRRLRVLSPPRSATAAATRRRSTTALLFGLAALAMLPCPARGQDADGDGVSDAQDICNNTPPGTAVDTAGRPLGDLNVDCDTDMEDFALMQTGFTGPFLAEVCDDGLDNDLDGAADCEDTLDCPLGTPCGPGSYCTQFQTCGCPPGTDDCDGDPVDGCEPLSTLTDCGACGVPCVLAHATESCASGTCAVASCDAGWCNIDGDDANGCEFRIDNNPACPVASFLGEVSGDSPSAPLVVSGLREERWHLVAVRESDLLGDEDLGVRVSLQSAPGGNFDLFVHCLTCSTQPVPSTTNPVDGGADNVFLGNHDLGGDSTYTILIEVRWGAGACDTEHPWELTVTGDQTTVVSYCN